MLLFCNTCKINNKTENNGIYVCFILKSFDLSQSILSGIGKGWVDYISIYSIHCIIIRTCHSQSLSCIDSIVDYNTSMYISKYYYNCILFHFQWVHDWYKTISNISFANYSASWLAATKLIVIMNFSNIPQLFHLNLHFIT